MSGFNRLECCHVACVTDCLASAAMSSQTGDGATETKPNLSTASNCKRNSIEMNKLPSQSALHLIG